MAEINSIELLTAFRRRKRSRGGKRWMVEGAIVDLDFVNQRYWWGGALRSSSDFTTFTGGTFSNGLVLDGVAANFDILIAYADLGISTPLSMHASFAPATVTGAMYAANLINTNSNILAIGTNNATALTSVIVAAVSQASITSGNVASIGVRLTVGAQFETNNILQSVNGAIGGAADTSASLFTPDFLRIGERPSSTNPFNGTLHRLTLFSGTKNQTQLNAESALVHAT